MNNTITKKNSIIDKSNQLIFKIVVIGHSSVGKTSIIQRYTKNEFAMRRMNTVGVDCETKILQINGESIKIQLFKWDTAGQERFKSLTKNYYRGCDAIIIVYDITNKTSFEAASSWLNDFMEKQEKEVLGKLIIGNKIDLQKMRTVSEEQGLKFANFHNFMYSEVSAKDNLNIEFTMGKLLNQMIQQKNMLVVSQKDMKKLQRQKSSDNLNKSDEFDRSNKSQNIIKSKHFDQSPVNTNYSSLGLNHSFFSKDRHNSISHQLEYHEKLLNISENQMLRPRKLSEEIQIQKTDKLQQYLQNSFENMKVNEDESLKKVENTELEQVPRIIEKQIQEQSQQQFRIPENMQPSQTQNQMKLVHPRISDALKKKHEKQNESMQYLNFNQIQMFAMLNIKYCIMCLSTLMVLDEY